MDKRSENRMKVITEIVMEFGDVGPNVVKDEIKFTNIGHAHTAKNKEIYGMGHRFFLQSGENDFKQISIKWGKSRCWFAASTGKKETIETAKVSENGIGTKKGDKDKEIVAKYQELWPVYKF